MFYLAGGLRLELSCIWINKVHASALEAAVPTVFVAWLHAWFVIQVPLHKAWQLFFWLKIWQWEKYYLF